MSQIDYRSEILRLKEKLDAIIVAHYYQKDEVFALADITGDSLELAKRAKASENEIVIFCGVGFMGQSVKSLAPHKRVFMPKVACCAMARMIDSDYFDENVAFLEQQGIPKEDILPITYINSNADVKAKVAQMGGMVCTSSNAKTIITNARQSGKRILFVPDRCLGENIAIQMGLNSYVIGESSGDVHDVDIFCYNGFCSVHQLFSVEDVEFFKARYEGIKIAIHPESKPEVCALADFVGSTSQIKHYVESLDEHQYVAVGTEFNFVNRLNHEKKFVLSSTKPECPTMNETTLEDLYVLLKSIDEGSAINEIFVDEETSKWANIALERMLKV